MKIYVVTRGSYDDYHIEKVFTNKKKAEEFARYNGDYSEGEAHVEMYDSADNYVPKHPGFTIKQAFKISKNSAGVWTDSCLDVSTVILSDCVGRNYSYLYELSEISEYCELSIERHFDESKYVKDDAEAKCTEIGMKLCEKIKNLLNKGYSASRINKELFKHIYG